MRESDQNYTKINKKGLQAKKILITAVLYTHNRLNYGDREKKIEYFKPNELRK